MDIAQLTAFLSTFLSVLMLSDEKVPKQAEQSFDQSRWTKAQKIWIELKSHFDTREALKMAAVQVARRPDSNARREVLEEEFIDLFQENPDLAASINQLIQDDQSNGKPDIQITQDVEGNGNQVIGQMSGGHIFGSVAENNVGICGGAIPSSWESTFLIQNASSAIKTILILAANPKGTSRLRLDQEIRALQEGLRRSRYRDNFRIEQRWAVRPKDVRRALLDCEPQIVHFSGHGIGQEVTENEPSALSKATVDNEDNSSYRTAVGILTIPEGLMLEDQAGQAQIVSGDTLTSLFALFADQIECVLLNACYSAAQADAIVKKIPYVVGMKRSIGDSAAIEFATGFYDALLAGQTVEFSFQLGCNAIQLQEIPEHLTPVLKKR